MTLIKENRGQVSLFMVTWAVINCPSLLLTMYYPPWHIRRSALPSLGVCNFSIRLQTAAEDLLKPDKGGIAVLSHFGLRQLYIKCCGMCAKQGNRSRWKERVLTGQKAYSALGLDIKLHSRHSGCWFRPKISSPGPSNVPFIYLKLITTIVYVCGIKCDDLIHTCSR